LTVTACASSTGQQTADEDRIAGTSPDRTDPGQVGEWDAVLAEADGQTVRWWMSGGDERINRYVDDHSLAVGGGRLTLPLVLLPFVDRDPQNTASLAIVFLVPPLLALAAVHGRWGHAGDERATARGSDG
jgi:hypothetical protein